MSSRLWKCGRVEGLVGRVFAWGGSLHGGEDLRGKNWGGSEAGEGCKMCQSEWDDHKVFAKNHCNQNEEVPMQMEVSEMCCLFHFCK